MSECVFCRRIERGEYEGDRVSGVVHFEPLNPVTRGHRLFVPVVHVANALAHPALTGLVFEHAAKWVKDKGVECNLITSSGKNATQTIRHLHVHVVPRVMGDGLHLPWTGQHKHDWRQAGATDALCVGCGRTASTTGGSR